MNQEQYYMADTNVQISVGRLDASGKFQSKLTKRYKNTGTELLTSSIARFIAGNAHTYNLGSGRPNYIGFGTRGILQQGDLTPDTNQVLEPDFSNPNPAASVRTRPWYNSTSLGGTTTDSVAEGDFWNPEYGWGTETQPELPVFSGELSTRPEITDKPLLRVPILRSEVDTDCPQDITYGENGYKSSVTFCGTSSTAWLDYLLNPEHGPRLEQIAISEIGLFEKSNADIHGLDTLLAGFRVPSAEDIIYLQKDEVIFVEWTITVRALMPFEQVQTITESKVTGVSLSGTDLGDKQVQFSAEVFGNNTPRQNIRWKATQQQSSDTTINASGVLTIGSDEESDCIEVTGAAEQNPAVAARTVVFPELKSDYVFGLVAVSVPESYLTIQYLGDVLGKGTYSHETNWSLSGQEHQDTEISAGGLLTVSMEETSANFTVIGTAVSDALVYGKATVTPLAQALAFKPYPLTRVSRLGKAVGRVAFASYKNQSACLVKISLVLDPQGADTCVIELRNYKQVIASFEQEVHPNISQTVDVEVPFITTNEKSQLSIVVRGNALVPTIESFVYGALLESLRWFEDTYDDDYIYEHTDSGAKTNVIYYIGEPTCPSVPEQIDLGDTTILRATSFAGSDVEMVMLPETLTTIE